MVFPGLKHEQVIHWYLLHVWVFLPVLQTVSPQLDTSPRCCSVGLGFAHLGRLCISAVKHIGFTCYFIKASRVKRTKCVQVCPCMSDFRPILRDHNYEIRSTEPCMTFSLAYRLTFVPSLMSTNYFPLTIQCSVFYNLTTTLPKASCTCNSVISFLIHSQYLNCNADRTDTLTITLILASCAFARFTQVR